MNVRGVVVATTPLYMMASSITAMKKGLFNNLLNNPFSLYSRTVD